MSKLKLEPLHWCIKWDKYEFQVIKKLWTAAVYLRDYDIAEYFKNGYTLYLNSGLSSSRNHYGQRVITREADLVTAHEFGHNWGSEHDPDMPECSPSASQGGSYLMYTYSVSGYDINNKVSSLYVFVRSY